MSVNQMSVKTRQESRLFRYADLEEKYRYEIDDRVSRYRAAMSLPGAKRDFTSYVQGLSPEVVRILIRELMIEDWYMQHEQLDASLHESYQELVEPSLLGTIFAEKISPALLLPNVNVGQSIPDVHGFEVKEEIGRGGTAIVYKARQLRFDRTVAIKIPLRSGQDLEPSERKRFYDEVRLQAKYLGAGVPAVFASSFGDYGVPYIAMEFVDGTKLEKYFPKGQPSRSECIDGFKRIAQVCRALAPMHEDGTLHLDLSPANVYFTKQDQVKILDFGFGYAKGLKPLETGIAGTLDYMAPEKSRGEKQFKPYTDVFSIGAFLFRMATGSPILPEGMADSEKLKRIAAGDYGDIQKDLKNAQQTLDLPAPLIDLTLKCLSIDPMNRPATSGEVADCIDDFFKAEQEELHRLQVQKARQDIIRRSLIAVLGVLALGSFVSVSFGIWAGIERQRAQRNERLRIQTLDTVVSIAAGDKLRKAGQTSLQKSLLSQLIPLVDVAAKSESNDLASLEQKALALNSLTNIQQGLQQADEAFANANEAEAISRQLCSSASASSIARMALGIALSNKALLLGMSGKFDEGIGHAAEASQLFSQLIDEDKTNQTAYLYFRLALIENTWANCLMRKAAAEQQENQQPAESHYITALTHVDAALKIAKESQYRAWRVKLLSNLALLTGAKPAGLKYANDSVQAARQLMNEEPAEIDSRECLAVALTNEGLIVLSSAADKASEATDSLREALELYSGLAVQIPMNIEFTWGKAMAHSNYADALAANKPSLVNLNTAMEHLKYADTIYQAMRRVTPDNQELAYYVDENNKRIQAVTELIANQQTSP